MARFGYRHPTIGLALLARHLPKGAAPILDAGAGTGLIGEWLAIMGYPVVEALDISAGMPAVARAKNVYAAFHQLALGQPFRARLSQVGSPHKYPKRGAAARSAPEY